MNLMKNLANVSAKEQIRFFRSFDHVILDMDGVIWLNWKALPEAPECVQNLKLLGKNVKFATNNGALSPEHILNRLKINNFQAGIEDLATPVITIVSYFKKINFQKEIFVISCKPLKEELKKCGFKLATEPPLEVVEDTPEKVASYNEGNESVGAVLIDTDVNISYMKVLKAIWCLLNPGCSLIIGADSKEIAVGEKGPLIGMYHFIEALKDVSEKEGIYLAKSSPYYVNFIKEKFLISDSKRALFIGDSVEQDMTTAVQGGFQKMLVLSGNTKLKDLNNWTYGEELKPAYYVEDLSILNKIIRSVFNLK